MIDLFATFSVENKESFDRDVESASLNRTEDLLICHSVLTKIWETS
jgi:hypothetical protein